MAFVNYMGGEKTEVKCLLSATSPVSCRLNSNSVVKIEQSFVTQTLLILNYMKICQYPSPHVHVYLLFSKLIMRLSFCTFCTFHMLIFYTLMVYYVVLKFFQ